MEFNKNMFQYFKRTIKQIIALTAVAALVIAFQIFAFSEPSFPPPQDNVAAPLNSSGAMQSKAGGLMLNTGGAQVGLLVDQGSVGIGIFPPTQKLDVAGF